MSKIVFRHARIIFAVLVFLSHIIGLFWLFSDNNLIDSKENELDIDGLLTSSYKFALANKSFDEFGYFLVIKNLNDVWKPSESQENQFNRSLVTLITQCSLNHVNNLLRIRKVWTGPISISVFIPNYKLNVGLNIIARLLQCYPSAMNNVHVHLVLPHHNITSPVFIIGEKIKNLCSHLSNDLEELKDIYENYEWKDYNYPNNLMRNVAESSVKTPYKLIIDIDIIPNPNLQEEFCKMIQKRPSYIDQMQMFVYVIPIFEVVSPLELITIQSKKNLLQSIELNRTRPFYHSLCTKCQRATNYQKWMKLKLSEEMKGAYEITWEPSYEPFYIVPTSAPHYDERFSQYGFNRVSHACELYVSGCRFIVLNNAFLLHEGFKSENSFHPRKHEDEINNGIKYEQFMEDLIKKYPASTRFC